MIVKADLHGLQYVARNMCADDADEIFATRREIDPDAIAAEASMSNAWLYQQDGVPLSAFGVAEAWPGVWNVWMFSVEQPSLRAGVEIVRHFRRNIAPYLLENGVHRVQCDSSATHKIAHEFIERFGGEVEFRMRGYGKGGEDFLRYMWGRASLELQASKTKRINPITKQE